MEERENIDTWQGIPEERFRRYKSWVTPSGYLCGTYAATVFLAYYQDYIDEQIIPKTVRRKNQLQPGALTDILRLLIQPHGLPTIAWQVAHGLSRFFTHFDLPYRGACHSFRRLAASLQTDRSRQTGDRWSLEAFRKYLRQSLGSRICLFRNRDRTLSKSS